MKPRLRVVGLIFLCIFFSLGHPSLSFAQVDCPECSVGVCLNTPLSNFLTGDFDQISSIGGGVNLINGGDPTNPADYTFSNNATQIEIVYNDGQTSVFTVTFLDNVYPNIIFTQNSGCHNYTFTSPDDDGLGWTYTWSISQNIQGIETDFTTGSGSSFNYIFPYGGEFDISINILTENCTETFTFELVVGEGELGLNFFENTSNTTTEIVNDYQVNFCGNTDDEPITIEILDNSIPASSFLNHQIDFDGTTFSPNPFDSPITILSQNPNEPGVYLLEYTATDISGCLYQENYTVIIVGFPDLSGGTYSTVGDVQCEGAEVVLEHSNEDTIPGQSYNVTLFCGDDLILQQWQFLDLPGTTPNLSYTPELGACNCDYSGILDGNDGSFGIQVQTSHPCVPDESTSDFSFFSHRTAPDAEFETFPSDTICQEDIDDLSFLWLQESAASPTACIITPQWDVFYEGVILESSQNNPFNPLISTFSSPGEYTIQLSAIANAFSPCEDDTSEITICVNPDINTLIPTANWNIPDPLCTGISFSPEVLYDQSLVTCDDPEIDWELTGPIDNEWLDVQSIDLDNLPFGTYTLSVSATIDDCPFIWQTDTTFSVVGGPNVYANNVNVPCFGNPIVFDQWFCIQDSGSALIDFDIQLFESDDSFDPDDCDIDGLTSIPLGWTADPDDYDPCTDPFSDDFQWEEPIVGSYVLYISATNECDTHTQCIEFSVDEPAPLIFDGIVADYCIGEELVDLTVLADTDPPNPPADPVGVSSGTFSFDCPNNFNCPGNMVYGSNSTWITTGYPPGDYTITFTLECYEPIDTVITLHEIPVIDLGTPDLILCQNVGTTITPIVINAPPLSIDCSWSGPNNFNLGECDLDIELPPDEEGTYTVTGTTDAGCSGTASINVQLESFSIISNTINIPCNQIGLDLNDLSFSNPVSFFDLDWEICELGQTNCETSVPDGNGIIDLSTFLNNTDYELHWEYTSPLGCIYSGIIPFSIGELSFPDLSETNIDTCLGVTVIIDENTGLNGSWEIVTCPNGPPCNYSFNSNNSQFEWDTSNDLNAQPGVYTVEYTGDCIQPVQSTITLNDIPSFQVFGPAIICQGGEVNLGTDYNGAGTPLWEANQPETIENDGTLNATVDSQQGSSVTYTLTITEDDCEGSNTVTVDHESQPWNDLNESLSFCDDSVTCVDLNSVLVANGWNSPEGDWTINPNVGPIPDGNEACVNFISLDPASYQLDLTYTSLLLQCDYSDSIELTIEPLVNITLNNYNPPESFCAGETFNPEVAFDPLLPNITATLISCPDGVGCDQEIDFSTYIFDTPGEYSIELAGTCYNDSVITITVNPIPVFNITTPGDNFNVCPGESITLSVDYLGSDSCLWTESGTLIPDLDDDCSINVTPTSSTTYEVEVFDLGCPGFQTEDVIILEDDCSLSCDAWNDEYCLNDSVCLDIQDLLMDCDVSDPNFTWFLNDAIVENNTICIDTLEIGTYYIKYDYLFSNNLNTCTFSDSCSFEIIELAPTDLQYENQLLTDTIEICLDESISIESGTVDTLGTWSIIDYPPGCYPNNADTLDPYTFNWASNSADNCDGVYTLMYTAVCKDTAFTVIQVFPNPEVNIQIDPGELICEDNSVTITVDYIGGNNVTNVWLDPDTSIDGDEIPPSVSNDPQFIWNFAPGNIEGEYTLFLADESPCPLQEDFTITIQEVFFDLALCSEMQDFCVNTDTLINLQELISGTIPNGQFDWHIIWPTTPPGTQGIGQIFNPSVYPEGDYAIYYDFLHGESQCIFSDTCSFTIEGLNPVIINSEVGYCLGSTNTITASYPAEYSGGWEVIEGDADCLTIIQDEPNTFQFIANCLGSYTIEFAGECLETEIIPFEILSIPNIEWTPDDLTPCQNECLDFEADLIENADIFQWTYDGNVVTSPLCFQDGNPGTLCLEATTIHNLQGQIIQCNDSICEILDPVESPGGVSDLPSEFCAGEDIIIGSFVNLGLYQDCEFLFPLATNTDCGQSVDLDENGPYGSFNYDLILSYGDGCQDLYEGPIFIPEPPSAELVIDYDSCEANVLVDLPGLQGDNLSFNWWVEADSSSNPNDNTFYPINILNDNSTALPDPNPIPLSTVGFNQDTPFIVGVTISNPSCDDFPWYTINLAETGLYVSPPVLDIDVFNGTGEPICTPAELIFQANISNTNILDSLAWSIAYVDELIYEETVENESLTPLFVFENTNITGVDTIFVTATAWNRCGSMTTTEEFYVLPDSVYFEIPPSLPGTCNGESLTFTAEPLIGEESIDQIMFGSDPIIPGLSWSSSDSVTFNVFIPETTPAGEYRLGLTMIGCGEETDSLDIFIFPDPDIAFSVEDESCSGVPTFFENQTEGAESFFWDFGDGTSPDYDTLPNPEHVYNQPGTYYPTLTAMSDQGCTVQLTDSISIYGPDASFELDEFMICSGEQVNYDFNQQENIISVEWEFFLPGVDTIISVADTNTFITMFNETDDVQFWTLSLTLQDIFGCTSQDETELIVFPQPHAFFTHSTLQDCIQGDEIEFNNESTSGSAAFWDFGDPESGLLNQTNVFSPTHIFSGVGQYTVTLTVTNSYFCTDEYRRLLRCNNLSLYVPNAFTPDENGFNDVFKPVIYGIEDIQFEESNYYTFEIFNRWGERVFTTHDPQKGWNGQSPNGEYYSQSEVYNWRVNIIFPDGAEDWVGTVTLVR